MSDFGLPEDGVIPGPKVWVSGPMATFYAQGGHWCVEFALKAPMQARELRMALGEVLIGLWDAHSDLEGDGNDG